MRLTEEKILAKLEKVIYSIEKKPQINVRGITEELETIIEPHKKPPKFKGEPLKIYIDLEIYYHDLCDLIDEGKENAGPNQVGALSDLRNIQEKYSITH
nr:hypothetical protein [Nanoarchaeota archaeon]